MNENEEMPEENSSSVNLSKESAYETVVRQNKMANIALEIDNDTLNKIGNLCITEYKVDVKSRSEWLISYRKAIRLARLLTETKSTPWENASNVKYPLLTQAAIQFNSRAMPEIVPSNTQIVKTRVLGPDKGGEKAARAQRVSAHMSFQCGVEMDDWVDEMDKLTISVPLVGTAFKKTYYDPRTKKNKSDLVLAEDLVVNYWAKSLETVPRITHKLYYYPNEIEELMRSGTFKRIDYATQAIESNDAEDGINDEKSQSQRTDPEDVDSPHFFIEQHRWYDLDGDGYKEPYIVTVLFDTEEVVRIVARYDIEGIEYNKETGEIIRIEPIHYFTKYGFIPSMDGSFYNMGFGLLIGHTNEAINTTINQLLDAGTDSTSGGGFISNSLQIGPGSGRVKRRYRFQPGTYYTVNAKGDDIRKSIMKRPTSEPSTVLLALLEFIINSSEKLMSSTEILSGQQSLANVPATTTMALIEQGLKVFGAIYKRLHRSLEKEFRKLYRLNSLFLDEEKFFNFHDEDYNIARDDYKTEDIDILPASDPNNVNDAQKLLKAEALLQQIGTGLNDEVIKRRYFEALQVENVDELFKVEEQPPDPKIVIEQEKVKIEHEKIDLEMQKFQRDLIIDEADITKTLGEVELTRAKVLETLAKAEGVEPGEQIQKYKKEADELTTHVNRQKEIIKKQMTLLGGLGNSTTEKKIEKTKRE